MTASLPMYDWPEVRDATDALWSGMSQLMGLSGPLLRQADHTMVWRSPDLCFSQTCGYPFTHEFRGRLIYVATPHYAVDGCDGPNYQSIVFAREKRPLEQYRGSSAAFNNPDSMSGMLALQLVFAPFATEGTFFGSVLKTGGHVNSLIAVRDGAADVCAVDAVCAAMARRYRPDYLEGLVEIARSPMVPSLPYITIACDTGVIRQALAQVFVDPALQKARDQLFLTGYSILEPGAYGRITDLETAMQQAGGLRLYD